MKAGQTSLFSFASPASLPSWKNGTFGGRCLSGRVYAAQPIVWGSRTRMVIGHLGKIKARTRAFPSGCWADFGTFVEAGPAVAQPHLLPLVSKWSFCQARFSSFLVRILARQGRQSNPVNILTPRKDVTTWGWASLVPITPRNDLKSKTQHAKPTCFRLTIRLHITLPFSHLLQTPVRSAEKVG
jgi:hypothetical protein